MYINASSVKKGEIGILRLAGFYRPGRACLSFWYYMYGKKMGELRVYVQRNRESSFPVWSKAGDQGTNWRLAAVDLEIGPGVSVEFAGIRGSGARGDIALDDVSLFTRSCFGKKLNILKPYEYISRSGLNVTGFVHYITVCQYLTPSF
ncbi:hypothetical protein CHS0354_003861 [Potamilus streckersoni]|uniref:MAM domain-containing protein n=1 Tax=Potamilus streckersoni TaxID=2493646 RepID=A0AAE0SGF7_9BIVA|nr:hypothetical protein CHS0354_003861 [Potamilus streckersoni]